MDTIVRVFYEGSTYDLDLGEDLPLRLDISAVEAGKVGSFFGVGSQSFYLPGTKNNNRFFLHAYNISQDDVPALYESVTAYIIKKGDTVLQGQLQLVEVVTGENNNYVQYKCQIVDSVVSFKDQLSSKLIKDANWAPYSHSLTSESIIQSWNADLLGGSIFYPIAEYGFDEKDNVQLPKHSYVPTGNPVTGNYLNNPFTPLLPLQLVPSVRVTDLIDVLFEQVNFIPSGSFYNDSNTENLYVLPKGQEKSGIVASDDAIPLFSAWNNYYPLQSISSSAGPTTGTDIEYPGVVTNVLNQYNSTDSTYTVTGIGNYSFDANIVFFNPVWSNPGESVTVEIQIGVGSYPFSYSVLSSNKVDLTSADGFNSFTLTTSVTDFLTVPGNEVWVKVNYTYSSAGPVGNLILYSGNFTCTDAPQVYPGSTVDMALQFDSKTKSLDVIKGLVQQFNLVLTPDPADSRIINIDYFDQWVREGAIKDWTQKYDTSKRKAINHTIDEVESIITFKQDKDTDRFSKDAIDQVPNLEYGSIEVIADNNLSQGKKDIGSFFGPLIIGAPFKYNSFDEDGIPTWNLNTGIQMAVPHLYKLNNSSIQTFKFKPRIGYKVEVPFDAGNSIYFGNPGSTTHLTSSYATLSNTSDLPVIPGSSKDTLFNNTYGDYVNSTMRLNQSVDAFTDNWKTYIDSLYWEGSKKLTIDVKFSSNEYKDIELNDKIFIKDNLYRINKISGFNVSHDDIAKVELIKLYPAYFQQDVVATPVPVTPVAPVAPSPPTPVPTVSPAPTVIPIPVTPIAPTAPTPAAPSPTAPVPINPRPPVTIGTYYLTEPQGQSNACAFSALGATVYALTTTLSDLGDTVQTIYADPQCTVPYFGNGYFYGITNVQGGVPVYEMVIMGTGIINSREDCPTISPAPVSAGEFYYGPAQGNSTNACDSTVNQGSLFVPYAPFVQYVQSGDTVYTDAGFSTPFVGNNSWYGLSDPNRATAMMAIQVNDFGRVVGRQDCIPLPPAPPPPSPSPAPLVASEYFLSDAFGSSVGCSSTTDGYKVYANTTNFDDILSGSISQIFTDATLSTPFFGNGYYYGISEFTSQSAAAEVVALSTGFISINQICQTVTPAPTSPGQLRRGTGAGSVNNVCGNTTDDGTVFVKNTPSVGYLDAGDQLYTNSSFTSRFNQSTNTWYGFSDPDQPYAQRAAQINTTGRVITTSDCVPIPPVPPIPTPAPVSAVESMYLSDTGYTTISGACAHAALDIEAFYDSNEVSASSGYPWTNGVKLYQDSGLTNVFTGSFLYWLSRPIINSYNPNNVSALFIYDDGKATQAGGLCGTVAPVTSYKMAINDNPPQTGNGACATTASVEVYSDTPFLNILSGDRIYYDATLQTDVTGSGYIGIASQTGSLPAKQAYLQQGGLLSMTTCAPIPPPVTSYEYKATSGFIGSTGPCTDFLDAYTFYSSRPDWSQFQTGDVIYTDAGLSNVSFLGGNGLVYGVGDSSMTYPSQSWSMVSGQLTNNYSCAGVPTPPPPVPISTYYSYELYPCSGVGAIYRSSNISHSAGTVVQLSGSGIGANCYTINSSNTFGGTVTEGLNTSSFGDCASCQATAPVPSPSPAPVTVFTLYTNDGFTTTVGCNTTASNAIYSSTNSAGLTAGYTVYSDAGLTTPVNGLSYYFGITDTQDGNPTQQIQISGLGTVSNVTNCSGAPPPVTPFTIYNNAGFSSAVGCNSSGSNTRFAATSSAHLTDGMVIYQDSGLNSPFDGNNLNFGHSDTVNGDPATSGYVSTTGVLSSVITCPPVPVPTTSYSHDIANRGNTLPDISCSDTFTGTVYTAVDFNNLTIGTIVYTDSGLTTPLDASSGVYTTGYYRLGSTGASYRVLINSAGSIQNFYPC